MLKRYKSKSCISLSVKLSTGGTTHVSFTPQTGGGSVYYTDNEKVQEGLEKHPKYGKLVYEDKIEEQTKEIEKAERLNQSLKQSIQKLDKKISLANTLTAKNKKQKK